MGEDGLAALLQSVVARSIGFRTSLPERPQRPRASYEDVRAAFDRPTPEHGTAPIAVIEELATMAEPGLHAIVGPRFFGWVIGASHPVGLAADWLTSAWGQNCGNHEAAPAAAAVEEVAARWLLDILALPKESSVGFVTGATVANFVCLAAARSEVLRRVGWDVEAKGLSGAPPIHVLIGDDAHTTVFSALQMLGIGYERIIRIATDAQGRMQPKAFASAITDVIEPIIVVTQAGQINTGAFDPFPEIIRIAHAHKAWVHIDGAFGLWARAADEFAEKAAGAERADSWAVDGHKWLQVPYDCGYAIVRNSAAHRRAMTAAASYLPAVQQGERDPTHYVPELSRRARGFATWAMIKHLGRDGISRMIARHCALAWRMARRLSDEPGIAVLNEVVLNQIVVRFAADQAPSLGNDMTREVIRRVQADGICFVGGATWRNRWVMRISVISWPTTETDADRAVDAIIEAWRSCQSHATS